MQMAGASKPFAHQNYKAITLWAAPALQTARDTPRIAFAPSFAEKKMNDTEFKENKIQQTDMIDMCLNS